MLTQIENVDVKFLIKTEKCENCFSSPTVNLKGWMCFCRPKAEDLEPKENDNINHPSHYTAYKGVEIIDLTEQMNFNRGNAVKYIARAGLKNLDTEIEDLEKAKWYIAREIERVTKEKKAVSVEDEEKVKCLFNTNLKGPTGTIKCAMAGCKLTVVRQTEAGRFSSYEIVDDTRCKNGYFRPANDVEVSKDAE